MNEKLDECLKKRHMEAIEALKILVECCEKNDIDYYLLAGSCLGAVRNGGIIPWDDDIDIGIKQSDYGKANKCLSVAFQGTQFTYVSRNLYSEYTRMYDKITVDGFNCIDIFILIPMPEKESQKKAIWRRKKFLYAAMKRKRTRVLHGKKSMMKKIKSKIGTLVTFPLVKFASLQWIELRLRENETRFQTAETPTSFLNLYSIYNMEQETIKGDWLRNYSTVLFEGMIVKTVGNTADYLTNLYGSDYMTPPPEELRIARHFDVKLIDA